MEFEKSYCNYAKNNPGVHQYYHDHQYGFPIEDDDELFKRLVLEINQAGLSWNTILNKQEGMSLAYDGFKIEVVANYGQEDRDRLLHDPRIIRNKLKVNAAIHNANQILKLKNDFGSFKQWLDIQHPKPKEEWVKLFKKTFKFTGGEITNEFLMSTGYLPGAHHPSCPIYKTVCEAKPMWLAQN